MRVLVLCTALATCLCLLATDPGARAGEPAKGPAPVKGKDPSPNRDVEVRFANGSSVLMTLLQERIEIVTQYGKLSIPPAEIRHIQFGTHMTEETRQKIDAAVARLGSEVYREREGALRELSGLGPQAYQTLQRVAKEGTGEQAKRAEMAMKHIARMVPPRLLKLKEEDQIRTGKFTVVGRIVTPSIKVRAEYFGELELKPAQLIAIRWLESAGERDVTVDAAKYGSNPEAWLDTGVVVEPHLGLQISATGQVDLRPQQAGQFITGPDGSEDVGGLGIGRRFGRPPGLDNGLPNAPGMLIGRIGDGPAFPVGSRYTRTPTRDGKLFLQIGTSPFGKASGQFNVKIIMGPYVTDDDN
jgi:hypothetical protein